jgi:DNA polymerase III subunit delta'
MVFPWQKEQWQQIWRAKQENRLPHALLFVGMTGTGKSHFVESYIRAQYCQHPGHTAKITACEMIDDRCNCHSCRLITGRAHPNILWIEPEKAGSIIKVDQVRDVSEFINQTSLQGEHRFVIINPANAMNLNAANALLKTLEEPSSGSMLILISDQASHLPATILSRCQRMHFPRPPTELALTWLTKQLPINSPDPELLLRLANGAPLAAMQLVEQQILSGRLALLQTLYSLSQPQADPIKSAVTIQDLDSIQFLDFILSWIIDLLRLQWGCNASDMTNKDFTTQLTNLHKRVSLKQIIQYMNYLQQLRGQISIGINLNKQLMVENVLVRWMECA